MSEKCLKILYVVIKGSFVIRFVILIVDLAAAAIPYLCVRWQHLFARYFDGVSHVLLPLEEGVIVLIPAGG